MSRSAAARQLLQTYRDSGALWTASLVADRVLPGGVLRLWRDVPVALDDLGAQVQAIFGAWRMPAAQIAITLEHLLYADLHGIDSHGCAMLRTYARDLAAGAWRPDAAVAVVHEHDTTALLDGGGGLGHVPGDTAIRLAIAKCAAHGVAAVAVRNSGHFGAAGSYAALAARAGMIGIATTDTRVPSVVPTVRPRRGARHEPDRVCRTGRAARRSCSTWRPAPHRSAGSAWQRTAVDKVPPGWALDARGRPETDARRAIAARRLTPLGGTSLHGSHKGYGLATMVEILSAVLPGNRLDPTPGRGAGARRPLLPGPRPASLPPGRRLRERSRRAARRAARHAPRRSGVAGAGRRRSRARARRGAAASRAASRTCSPSTTAATFTRAPSGRSSRTIRRCCSTSSRRSSRAASCCAWRRSTVQPSTARSHGQAGARAAARRRHR